MRDSSGGTLPTQVWMNARPDLTSARLSAYLSCDAPDPGMTPRAIIATSPIRPEITRIEDLPAWAERPLPPLNPAHSP